MRVYALCRSGMRWSRRRIMGCMAVGFLSAMSASAFIIYKALHAVTSLSLLD